MRARPERAYIWAYARGELDAQAGVIYEFCPGRGSQYPVAFLGAAQGPPGSPLRDPPAWSGTLVCDQYAGYDRVLDRRVYPQRIAAHCVAHARRKFDELVGTSEVAKEAIRRIGWIYHVEGQFEAMDAQQRLAARDELTRPLWQALHVWLKLERGRVADGGGVAGAIDYSLNSWASLTRHLEDGAVPIDNNFIERQIKPWAMGTNKAKSAFMQILRRRATRLPSERGHGRVVVASHNHSDCRNCMRAFGGRYREGLTSGCLRRARARSFIARSASTYMCVVDGLS